MTTVNETSNWRSGRPILKAKNGRSTTTGCTATTTAKNPDQHVLRRMAQIADDLGARLQGDDGEFYGLEGEPLPE